MTIITSTCSSRAGTSDNQIDIAEVLANYGASLSVLNSVGYMPLHYCAIQVYWVKFLCFPYLFGI